MPSGRYKRVRDSGEAMENVVRRPGESDEEYAQRQLEAGLSYVTQPETWAMAEEYMEQNPPAPGRGVEVPGLHGDTPGAALATASQGGPPSQGVAPTVSPWGDEGMGSAYPEAGGVQAPTPGLMLQRQATRADRGAEHLQQEEDHQRRKERQDDWMAQVQAFIGGNQQEVF
jgi:hypothetical protein